MFRQDVANQREPEKHREGGEDGIRTLFDLGWSYPVKSVEDHFSGVERVVIGPSSGPGATVSVPARKALVGRFGATNADRFMNADHSGQSAPCIFKLCLAIAPLHERRPTMRAARGRQRATLMSLW